MSRYRPQRRLREEERMAGVMPLTRKLGEYFERDSPPVIEPIRDQIFRPRRRDLWPPETWAEMQRIYEGKES